MKLTDSINTLRGTLAFTLFLVAGGIYQAILLAQKLGVSSASIKWTTAFVLGGLTLITTLLLFIASWTPMKDKMLQSLERGKNLLQGTRGLHGWVFGALCLLYPYLILGPISQFTETFFMRAMIFWILALVGAILLYIRRHEGGFPAMLIFSILVMGTIYRGAAYLPQINNYPFSLTWSEASRYFYASLFFSERVYGTHANPTVLHPTRYMLQSLPFLIPNSPLWLHRFWQALLWLATNLATATLLVRRLEQHIGTLRVTSIPSNYDANPQKSQPSSGVINKSVKLWIVLLWTFLSLYQGPVWYHLLVMAIIVLWGFDSNRFWKSLAIITLASAWGGISRINWIPFPAALGIMLYFLEKEVSGQTVWRYLLAPIVWSVTGLATGLGSQVLYAVLSGNQLEQFGSSLSSELLWYRWFPSATFPLGVLPGILLVSLPIFWLIFQRMSRRWGHLHPIRLMGMAAILLVFFSGGMLVSAKIGGGSNLHNLDGYLVLLLVFGTHIFFGKVAEEGGAKFPNRFQPALVPLVLAILVPLGFTISSGRSIDLLKPGKTHQALAQIEQAVTQTVQSGGEVLFISERQLVTFDLVGEVPLVADYEKVFLMEMAMAGNSNYLGKFQEDLENHRFDLILTSPQRVNFQGSDHEFGEENDVWVKRISIPILCNYQEKLLINEPRVQLLVPDPDGPNCPGY